MKKILSKLSVLALLSVGAFMVSCEKENDLLVDDLAGLETMAVNPRSNFSNFRVASNVTPCQDPVTVDLIAGQKLRVGEVSVYNDETKLYVTVSIKEEYKDWYMRKASLYFGNSSQTQGMKNPSPGKFPALQDFPSSNNLGEQDYTFELDEQVKIALEAFDNFDIAIHVDLVRVAVDENKEPVLVNGLATVLQKEGAWGEGARFSDLSNIKSNNWAMYFSYSIQECTEAPVCEFSWRRLGNGGNGNDNTVIENFDLSNAIIEEGEEFAILDGSKIVGTASFYRTNIGGGVRKVFVTFGLTELGQTLGYTFVEYGAAYATTDALPADALFTKASNTTGGVIELAANNANPYYVGLYVKVAGSCTP
jgi:hypothetical protein